LTFFIAILETESRFPTLWPPSCKSLRRHNSAADGPICMTFGVPTQNHMPMTMKTSKWKPVI